MIFKQDDFIHSLLQSPWADFFKDLNSRYSEIFEVSSYTIRSGDQQISDVITKSTGNLTPVEIKRVFEDHDFILSLNCNINQLNENFVKNYVKLEVDQHITKVLNKHLEFHIYRDDLTEVHNYRCLHKDVQNQIEQSKENDTKFTLVFVDLDNFKSINDTHGHIVGSSILRQLSHKLITYNKDQDFKIYRYGGDEFVFLCEDDSEEAEKKIRKLLSKLAKDKFKVMKDEEKNIELSVGFAEYPRDGKDFKEIIDIADKMMYEAKKQGKYQKNVRIKRYNKAS